MSSHLRLTKANSQNDSWLIHLWTILKVITLGWVAFDKSSIINRKFTPEKYLREKSATGIHLCEHDAINQTRRSSEIANYAANGILKAFLRDRDINLFLIICKRFLRL